MSSADELHVVSGREGLTGSQESPCQELKLAHDGRDHNLGTLTVCMMTPALHMLQIDEVQIDPARGGRASTPVLRRSNGADCPSVKDRVTSRKR
jgi:hypothetical protein